MKKIILKKFKKIQLPLSFKKKKSNYIIKKDTLNNPPDYNNKFLILI